MISKLSDLFTSLTQRMLSLPPIALIGIGVGILVFLGVIITVIVLLAKRAPTPNSTFRMPSSGAQELASSSEKQARKTAKTARAIRRAEQAEKAAREGKPAPGKRGRIVAIAIVAAVVIGGAVGLYASGVTPGSVAASLRGNIGTPPPERTGNAPDGQLLYDADGVRITATNVYQSDEEIEITLMIENRTVMNLSFSDHSFALGGIMTGTTLLDSDCAVPAGDKVSVTMTIDSGVLYDTELSKVRCIDTALRGENSDTHLTVLETGLLEIETDSFDGQHDTLGGTAIYKKDGVLVNKRTAPEDSTDFLFSVVNEGEEYFTYHMESLTINNVSVPGRDYDMAEISVLPGCEAAITLTPNPSFLRSNFITDIAQLTWALEVQPAGRPELTYLTSTITHRTGITLPENTEDIPVERAPGDGITTSGGVGPFIDVDRHSYCAEAVLWAYESDITRGTSSVHFSPYEPCTRGQMVTFLWNSMGFPQASPEAAENFAFSDVSPTSSCYQAVLWAAEQGILTGTTPSTFSPDLPINRGQLVTMLWRLYGSPEVDPGVVWNPFTDVSDADEYYMSVLWAVESGITSGTDARTFSPNGIINRGQAVTFLMRYFSFLG